MGRVKWIHLNICPKWSFHLKPLLNMWHTQRDEHLSPFRVSDRDKSFRKCVCVRKHLHVSVCPCACVCVCVEPFSGCASPCFENQMENQYLPLLSESNRTEHDFGQMDWLRIQCETITDISFGFCAGSIASFSWPVVVLTYPAIPLDSILFANSTSFEYTSYCHCLCPKMPANIAPVCIPTRISTGELVFCCTYLRKSEKRQLNESNLEFIVSSRIECKAKENDKEWGRKKSIKNYKWIFSKSNFS